MPKTVPKGDFRLVRIVIMNCRPYTKAEMCCKLYLCDYWVLAK